MEQRRRSQRSAFEMDIRAVGEGLALGQSASGLVCPDCKGGRNRDKSFVVTRTETGYLYVCHRASCSVAGYVGRFEDSGGLLVRGHTPGKCPQRTQSRTFSGTLAEIPQRIQDFLQENYCIGPERSVRGRLKWCVEDERLWMPCIRWDGVETGAQARKLDGTKPKVLSYRDGDRPGLAWYVPEKAKNFPAVLVVEDQLSALRASEFVPSVALLGTHLSWDRITELATVTNKIHLALDKDATTKSYDYRKKFGAYLDIRVVALEKDLKNLTPKELEDKLKELT